MNNQVILIGRIANIKEEKNIITLAIPRSHKNADGIYEIDFIDCQLFGSVAENTKEYCRDGDLIGIKGTLQTKNKKNVVIAERVTFLTTGCKNNNTEEA